MNKYFRSLCTLLGKRVRALREEMGISQEELAFRAEIDRTYISQIERGIGNPSLLVLFKISGVLGVTVPDLFERLGGER